MAGHPALGAWEAINEPEGSVLVRKQHRCSAELCQYLQKISPATINNIYFKYFILGADKCFFQVESNSNSCYDTTIIGQSGAGYNGVGIKMER